MVALSLPFSKWEAIFKDPMTTAAAIGRLVHHFVILELNIPSYRVEQAKKSRLDPAEASWRNRRNSQFHWNSHDSTKKEKIKKKKIRRRVCCAINRKNGRNNCRLTRGGGSWRPLFRLKIRRLGARHPPSPTSRTEQARHVAGPRVNGGLRCAIPPYFAQHVRRGATTGPTSCHALGSIHAPDSV